MRPEHLVEFVGERRDGVGDLRAPLLGPPRPRQCRLRGLDGVGHVLGVGAAFGLQVVAEARHAGFEALLWVLLVLVVGHREVGALEVSFDTVEGRLHAVEVGLRLRALEVGFDPVETVVEGVGRRVCRLVGPRRPVGFGGVLVVPVAHTSNIRPYPKRAFPFGAPHRSGRYPAGGAVGL